MCKSEQRHTQCKANTKLKNLVLLTTLNSKEAETIQYIRYGKGQYSDIINQRETDPRKVEIKTKMECGKK